MGEKISINTSTILIGIVLILLIGGIVFLGSQKNNTDTPQINKTQVTVLQNNTLQNSTQNITNQTQIKPITIDNISINELMNGSMVMGSNSSPIIMVEFSDMQCPFCRKFWYQSLANIKTEYIQTGKVQFVFRNLPLDAHPMAEKSAEALLCAKEQGKEWELHDKIYLEQIKIGALGTVMYGSYELVKWANETGLNTTSFQECLSTDRYLNEINKDKTYAKSLGFDNTPSFIIAKRNGNNIIPIIGAQKYPTFNATINELLKYN